MTYGAIFIGVIKQLKQVLNWGLALSEPITKMAGNMEAGRQAGLAPGQWLRAYI